MPHSEQNELTIDLGVLVIARQENEAAIRRIKTAWKQVHFSTGYEAIRVFDFP